MSEEEMKALVEMNNMLKHENEKLKQDKQELTKIVETYKDKEDKLRELIDNYIHDDFGELSLDDILQILNEGDK